MTPKEKASDLLTRLSESATGSGIRSVLPASQEKLPEPHAKPSAPAVQRFMVNLPKSQHRFIRQFALEADSDVSTIVRLLLARIETDPAFAEEVRTQLPDKQ